MDHRVIPIDGHNPYAEHPGFSASHCALRYTVTQRSPYGAIQSCGFGCEMTGGHCIPGDFCASRREKAARQDAFAELIITKDAP